MNIKFWVVIGKVKQLAFRDDGSQYEIDVDFPVGDQHIVHNEILLWRQGRESIKGKLGAKKQKTVANRIANVPLCEKCEKKFKENPNLGWQTWINPSELKRSPTTIKISPILKGELNDNQGQVVHSEPHEEYQNIGENLEKDQAGILLHNHH